MRTQPSARVRFGIFEIDLTAGGIRKAGLKIRIQDQPFHVLTLLLEHPGDVVTREDLRQKLWPRDTFVDFDHSLNTAINKLREALGDGAESPRYVETVPKRGYRFRPKEEPAYRRFRAGCGDCGGAASDKKRGAGEPRPSSQKERKLTRAWSTS